MKEFKKIKKGLYHEIKELEEKTIKILVKTHRESDAIGEGFYHF